MSKEIMTALTGMFQPGLTYDSVSRCFSGQKHSRPLTCARNREKGIPPSLAKAKSWRDAVATLLIQPQTVKVIRIAVMVDAPPWLLVTL